MEWDSVPYFAGQSRRAHRVHREVRFARPSRHEGKSGGTRVVYYLLDRRDRIYLLLVYSKTVKDNLTRAEENELRTLAQELEAEEP